MQRAFMLSTLCLAWMPGALAGAAEGGKLVPSITVVGHGEVDVQPDMATVNLGVTTEAKTAAEALEENNQRMAELLETLRGFNVPDKHVQTTSFSVNPKQVIDRDRREPPKIVGYTVTNQVSVKVLELDRLGALLDAVVKAGSNRVQGVGFSLSGPGPHVDQARRKAMADARARAELYAGEAQVKLGAPLLIEEQSAMVPQPRFVLGAELNAAPAAAVPIARGEQTVSAHITVTYAIAE